MKKDPYNLLFTIIGKTIMVCVCLFIYSSVARLCYTIAVDDVNTFAQGFFFLVFITFVSALTYVSAVLMFTELFKTKN